MMNISNRIFAYIDDIQNNASELNRKVASAKERWDDVNYENIAEATASRILSDAQAFCSTARNDAQMMYNDIQNIQSIINDL